MLQNLHGLGRWAPSLTGAAKPREAARRGGAARSREAAKPRDCRWRCEKPRSYTRMRVALREATRRWRCEILVGFSRYLGTGSLSGGAANAVWRTVAHCGALRGAVWRFVALCGALWRTVAHCGAVWRTVAHCGAAWRTAAHSGALWRTVAHCGAVWRTVLAHCGALFWRTVAHCFGALWRTESRCFAASCGFSRLRRVSRLHGFAASRLLAASLVFAEPRCPNYENLDLRCPSWPILNNKPPALT